MCHTKIPDVNHQLFLHRYFLMLLLLLLLLVLPLLIHLPTPQSRFLPSIQFHTIFRHFHFVKFQCHRQPNRQSLIRPFSCDQNRSFFPHNWLAIFHVIFYAKYFDCWRYTLLPVQWKMNRMMCRYGQTVNKQNKKKIKKTKNKLKWMEMLKMRSQMSNANFVCILKLRRQLRIHLFTCKRIYFSFAVVDVDWFKNHFRWLTSTEVSGKLNRLLHKINM